MKGKVDVSTGEVVPFGIRPVLRAAYDDHMPVSDSSGLRCEDESLASQSALEESDINTLVRRFGLVELAALSGTRAWSAGDFTELKSPREMAQLLVEAQASFMALPAGVRSEFDNDPLRFVEFCSIDSNYDRICDLGLLAPEAMETRVQARRAKDAADMEQRVQAELAKREKASGEAGHS